MKTDGFVYDSQFMFLKEQDELNQKYEQLVLSKTERKTVNGTDIFLSQEKWDSDTFGKKIGRVHWIENNIEEKKDIASVIESLSHYDCSYLRLNQHHSFCRFSKDVIAPVSTKITQHISLNHDFTFDPAHDYKIYKQDESDNSILSQAFALSEQSFNHGRFRADNFFKKEQIDSMYSSWIKNEIAHPGSTLFYVAEDGKLASFLLYRDNISPLAKIKIGFVSLVASSAEFKGRSYASHLLNFVLKTAGHQHTQFVIANTEGTNTEALGFFRKNGFIETASLNEYHIWN